MDIKLNEDKDWHNVRTTVFIEEQGFTNEFDDIDAYALHVTAYEEGKLIGCGRIYPADDSTTYHLGRLAILKEFRGKNFGSRLVAELEFEAKQHGAFCIKLDAQKQAMPFYESLGYVEYGEVHMDEHVEHVEMMKII